MAVRRSNATIPLSDDRITQLQSGIDFFLRGYGRSSPELSPEARSDWRKYGHLLGADESWWAWRTFGPPKQK